METVSGLTYMFSKEGILRSVIIIFQCVAISLIALSNRLKYEGLLAWVLAAYVISWCISLASYLLIATTLYKKIKFKVDYKIIDVCASVFLFCHYLVATLVLSMYTYSNLELIAADVIGIMTSSLYFIEACFGKEHVAKTLGYIFTKPGILKAVICLFGILTSALLDASGHECYYPDGCDAARKWALAAFLISMIGSVALALLHITRIATKFEKKFKKIDLGWSLFSFLNYLIAALVLACYLKCSFFKFRECDLRLASNIFGFATSLLYAVEVYFLKPLIPLPAVPDEAPDS